MKTKSTDEKKQEEITESRFDNEKASVSFLNSDHWCALRTNYALALIDRLLMLWQKSGNIGRTPSGQDLDADFLATKINQSSWLTASLTTIRGQTTENNNSDAIAAYLLDLATLEGKHLPSF